VAIDNRGGGGQTPLPFSNVLDTSPELLTALARGEHAAIAALACVWSSNAWIMANALEGKFRKFRKNWPGYSRVTTLNLSKMLPGLQYPEVRKNLPELIQDLHPQLSLCASLHRSAIMTVLPTLRDPISPFCLRLILTASENPVADSAALKYGLPPVLLLGSALRGSYSVFDYSPRQVVVSWRSKANRELCWKLGYNCLAPLSFIREGSKTVNQIRSSYNFNLVSDSWRHGRLIVTAKSSSTTLKSKLSGLTAVLTIAAGRRRK